MVQLNVNKDKELNIYGSLKDRANNLINSEDYLRKLQDIKNGNIRSMKVMDFVLNGITLGMPFTG